MSTSDSPPVSRHGFQHLHQKVSLPLRADGNHRHEFTPVDSSVPVRFICHPASTPGPMRNTIADQVCKPSQGSPPSTQSKGGRARSRAPSFEQTAEHQAVSSGAFTGLQNILPAGFWTRPRARASSAGPLGWRYARGYGSGP